MSRYVDSAAQSGCDGEDNAQEPSSDEEQEVEEEEVEEQEVEYTADRRPSATVGRSGAVVHPAPAAQQSHTSQPRAVAVGEGNSEVDKYLVLETRRKMTWKPVNTGAREGRFKEEDVPVEWKQ